MVLRMAAQVVCWGRLLCLCGVAVALLGVPASTARAQAPAASAEDVEEAKARFAAGNKAFSQGEYREAVSEFQGGYMLTRNPGFLLNIAVCYRKLGEAEQALSHFKDYLKAEPQSPRKAEVQKQIAELEAQVAPQKPGDAAKGPARLADGTLDPAAAPAAVEAKAPPVAKPEKKTPPPVTAAVPAPKGPLVDSADEDDGMALVVAKRRGGTSPQRISRRARQDSTDKDEPDQESSGHMWLWVALGGAVLTGVVVAFALSGQKTESGTLGSVDLR